MVDQTLLTHSSSELSGGMLAVVCCGDEPPSVTSGESSESVKLDMLFLVKSSENLYSVIENY